MERPPQLAFYEVGVPMPRAFILNISQVAERKRQAMACFAPPAAANSTLLTDDSSCLTTAFAVNAA